MLLGKMICVLSRQHKRGRRAGEQERMPDGRIKIEYQCPRCGATWYRKVRAGEQNGGHPGDQA